MYTKEDLSLRTAASKTYSLGSGRYHTTLFPQTVHVKNTSGEWAEIDNTLREDKDGSGRLLRNTDNPALSISLRSGNSSELVCLKDQNGYTLSCSVPEASDIQPQIVQGPPVPDPEDPLSYDRILRQINTQAEYKDIFPGTTFNCYIRSTMFKDEWVFSEKENVRPIVLNVTAPGLHLSLNDKNQIEASAPSGEIPFTILAPFMKQSDDCGTLGAVEVSLAPSDDHPDAWALTYAPDPEWIDQAKFPVILDPAVITFTSSSAVQDNYVTSAQPTTVQSSTYAALRVSQGHATWGTSKAFIQFLDSALPNIDSSYYITKAEFKINTAPSNSYGINPNPTSALTVNLREVTGSWSDTTITYNNAPSVSDKILDYAYVQSPSTRYTWDISNLVRKWYNGDNNGIVLEAASNACVCLCSSEHPSSNPFVSIDYVSLAGVEGSLAYEQQSAGRAGTGYVSLYNGNLIFEHEDSSTSGNLMPVSVTHYYNSCYYNQDPFGCGNGWKTNLQQCLHRETLTDSTGNVTYYVYTDSDGTRHHFKQESGEWKDLSGLGMKLTVSGSSVTITDKGDNKLSFDLPTAEFNNNYANVKMLKSIADSCGNTMTITTNSSRIITNARDGALRDTAVAVSGHIANIIPPGYSSGYCGFAYDSNGYLTTAWHTDGGNGTHSASYTYNSLGLLATVTNFDGLKLSYTYTTQRPDGPYRVSRVEITNGSTYYGGRKYEYGDCMTTVTDLVPNSAQTALTEGKKLFYHFNDYGNVTSVNDQLGYAVFAQYASGYVNHPSMVSRMQRTVNNLLVKHDMESSGGWTEQLLNNAAGTYSYSATRVYMGAKSFRMQKHNSVGYVTGYQDVTLTKGVTYTFSGYLQTMDSTTGRLRVTYKDSAGNDVNADGDERKSINMWRRQVLTFTLPSNSTSNSVRVRVMAGGSDGSAFFDCMQLEEGPVANSYNMLTNSDFSRNTNAVPSYWTANSGNTASDKVYSTPSGTKPEGLSANVMRVYGGGRGSAKGFWQEIASTGNTGDVYAAGGWAFSYTHPFHDNTKSLAIRLSFLKTGTSTYMDAEPVQWSEEWTDWQMAAGLVAAPCNHTSIRFCIDYQDNVNYAEFDGLYLFKEQFGQRISYDAQQNVTDVTDLSGAKCYATYDSFNNMLTYRPYGRGTDSTYTQTWGTTDAEKKKHLLRTETTPTGTVTTLGYDSKGNRTSQQVKSSDNTLIMNGTTTYTSDQNYVASSTDARGKTVTSSVNTALGTLTSVTDPRGQTVSYTYDNLKRVTNVQSTANSKTYKNTYTYSNDHLSKVAHNTTSDSSCDVQYNFGYDNAGRPTTVSVGSQTLSTNTYNPDGTLNKVTYGNGAVLNYTYDAFKRVSSMKHTGETYNLVDILYDANGQVACERDPRHNRQTYYEYDFARRPSRYALMSGMTNMCTQELWYDSYGNPSSMVEQIGAERTEYKTAWTYDVQNRPKRVYYKEECHRVDYSYDGIGRIKRRTQAWGADEYVSNITYVAGANGGNTSPLISNINQPNENHTYTYDDAGNILSVKRGSITTTYAYDGIGQLTRVNDPNDTAGGSSGTTWVYEYDRGGNMTAKKRYAYTTGTLGTLQQTIAYTYGDSNWKDKLTAYNGQTFTYDAIGNVTSAEGWTYTWNRGRQLVGIKKGTAGTAGYEEHNFDYDHKGRCIGRTYVYYDTSRSKNVWRGYSYTWEGDRLVHLVTSNRVGDTGNYTTDETMHFHYDAQGKPSMMMYNGTRFGYLYNAQGDVIGIITGGLTEKVKYTYDAWGRLLSITGSSANTLGKANPFRYRAYIYDQECGLYYLRTRYYNPNWCRFINADAFLGRTSLLLSHSSYSYCKNSPVSRIDALGEEDIYVFFYNRENSNASLLLQAQTAVYYDSTANNVHMVEVGYSQELIDEWNAMDDNNLGNVYFILHGSSGRIVFDELNGEYISFEEDNGNAFFSSFTPKKIKNALYMLNCHGADSSKGQSVAEFFAKLCKTDVYACVCGVSYTKLPIINRTYAREEEREFLNPFSYNWRLLRYNNTIIEYVLFSEWLN